jgi:hypothetical protein
MNQKTVFISADHGLATIYFLQSDLVEYLLDAGFQIVLLTADGLVSEIAARYGRPGMIVEGLRLERARAYARRGSELQWWLAYLRRAGSSGKINTAAMDSYVRQAAVEQPNRRRLLMPIARSLLGLMRRSRTIRKSIENLQARFTPGIYADLFERYAPRLVVASTPGWRLDRYLLREAAAAGISTAAMTVGWDNPSSYGLAGAPKGWINCWSDIQMQELINGSDWPADRVNIGGIPAYDGYFRRQWERPRDEYFDHHGLDPERKLLAYACSFVSFSPSMQNLEPLAELVQNGAFDQPAQLLIRLHPNHFQQNPLFISERKAILDLAKTHPHIYVVKPEPLGGEFGYYSGEDMPEKASMMAHADVFLTVYSTMVVEAAIHDRPIVSVCIDAEKGWNRPRKFSLPLSEIGDWPTHTRFRSARAGKVVGDRQALKQAIQEYLANPELDREERLAFVEREVTYTDGRAAERTAEFIVSLI